MHSGLPIILLIALVGIVTIGTVSGWWTRAFWFVVIYVRCWRDPVTDATGGRPERELQPVWQHAGQVAKEQSDPQWSESNTHDLPRLKGYDPWQWDFDAKL